MGGGGGLRVRVMGGRDRSDDALTEGVYSLAHGYSVHCTQRDIEYIVHKLATFYIGSTNTT